MVYPTSTTTFVLNDNTTALSASTTYTFDVICVQQTKDFMTDFYYTYYLWCYILTTILAVYLNKNNKSHVLMSLILLLDVLATIDITHFY